MLIRKYEENDLSAILSLFYETVLAVNSKDYSQKQCHIWASCISDRKKWAELLCTCFTFVCEDANGQVIGFGSLQNDGLIVHLFVHKNFQNKGVASQILDTIEKKAETLKLNTIVVEASVTALPFFLAKGFCIKKKQSVVRQEVPLSNYLMQKSLVPSDKEPFP